MSYFNFKVVANVWLFTIVEYSELYHQHTQYINVHFVILRSLFVVVDLRDTLRLRTVDASDAIAAFYWFGLCRCIRLVLL